MPFLDSSKVKLEDIRRTAPFCGIYQLHKRCRSILDGLWVHATNDDEIAFDYYGSIPSQPRADAPRCPTPIVFRSKDQRAHRMEERQMEAIWGQATAHIKTALPSPQDPITSMGVGCIMTTAVFWPRARHIAQAGNIKLTRNDILRDHISSGGDFGSEESSEWDEDDNDDEVDVNHDNDAPQEDASDNYVDEDSSSSSSSSSGSAFPGEMHTK